MQFALIFKSRTPAKRATAILLADGYDAHIEPGWSGNGTYWAIGPVPTGDADAFTARLKRLAETLEGDFIGYGGMAGMPWLAQLALWEPQE